MISNPTANPDCVNPQGNANKEEPIIVFQILNIKAISPLFDSFTCISPSSPTSTSGCCFPPKNERIELKSGKNISEGITCAGTSKCLFSSSVASGAPDNLL